MILLNESSTLEFSVNIQNTTSKLDRASLVIECSGYEISFPINLTEDKATVVLPILEHIVPSGKNNIRMEMVIGNSLYIPFRDSMEFFAPPNIKVESFKPVTLPVTPSFGPIIVVENKKEIVTREQEEITPVSIYHSQFSALMDEAENIIRNK